MHQVTAVSYIPVWLRLASPINEEPVLHGESPQTTNSPNSQSRKIPEHCSPSTVPGRAIFGDCSRARSGQSSILLPFVFLAVLAHPQRATPRPRHVVRPELGCCRYGVAVGMWPDPGMRWGSENHAPHLNPTTVGARLLQFPDAIQPL